MRRLLIVSNRLPVTVSASGGHFDVSPSAGGLATGLQGPHQKSQGLWIGWPGDVSTLGDEQRGELERELAELRAVPVYLGPEEVAGYYAGVSNGLLWPLFHYLIDRLPYRPQDWLTYRDVNQRFAEATCRHYRPGDLIWVHDYQLALVPGMVRARLPGASIGFFLHIPFPAAEVFRLLPWRAELLRGLLGADLIGFHTFSYVRQFINTLTLTLGLMPQADRVQFEGREVKLWAYPMGVDAAAFDALARDPELKEQAYRLRQQSSERHVILGVDRLDYTKGIPRRLHAIERLLEQQPSLRGDLRLVQLAVPSRGDVQEYESFTGEVQQLVGRINGRFSTPSSVPIHFLHQNLGRRELVSLYEAADLMLVTPLRDGMNLVAKEFVASRSDEDGVLVLSELAGAASEMGEALLTNPYDVDGTAAAVARGLEMRRTERRARMRALRERVFEYDVHRWADHFLGDLAAAARPAVKTREPRSDARELAATLRAGDRVLWLLDYDGTLMPFSESPGLAAPDPELLELLGALAGDPRMRIHVVSGRSYETLDEWLGALPVGLHGEHGLWSRGQSGWRMNREVDQGWKERVRPMLRELAARTPGSLVEEKTAALAWHYRMSDREYGERQARELKIHLAHSLSNVAVEVLSGNKVVEVRPHGVNKGMIVPGLIEAASDALVVAVGDDETDEDLFRALPEGALSIVVGARESLARCSLPDVASVRELLRAALRSNRLAEKVRSRGGQPAGELSREEVPA